MIRIEEADGNVHNLAYDASGNRFERREKDDRKYDAGGRLAEDREHFYHYDCEGNLVFKEFKELSWGGGVIAPINKERLETELGITFRAFGTGWRYDWQSDGMLARVVRPHGKEVSFAYDALGRRIRKSFAGTTTHFVWDGNVPLHEWTEMAEVSESSETEKNGTGNNNLIIWLFEQGTFVPAAKLMSNGDCFSIVSDYLGTPMQAYDKEGNKVWSRSWTSTDDSGNAPLRSYRSSTRDNMRIGRRDFIIIGSATTPQGLEHTSAKTQLG